MQLENLEIDGELERLLDERLDPAALALSYDGCFREAWPGSDFTEIVMPILDLFPLIRLYEWRVSYLKLNPGLEGETTGIFRFINEDSFFGTSLDANPVFSIRYGRDGTKEMLFNYDPLVESVMLEELLGEGFFREVWSRQKLMRPSPDERRETYSQFSANHERAIAISKIVPHATGVRDFMPRSRLSDDQVIQVLMSEYTFGQGGKSDKKRYLETRGLGPCIAVTIYDRATKIGAIAHITSLTDQGTLFGDVARMYGTWAPGHELHCRIVGGMSMLSVDTLYDIYQNLAKIPGLAIIEEDVMMNGFYNVVLDLEDGALYNTENISRKRLPGFDRTDKTDGVPVYYADPKGFNR